MAKAIKRKATFSLTEPSAQSVQLAGDFTEWDKNAIALKRQKDGLWKVAVSLPPGTYQYRFLVDGQWRDDPACESRVPNPFGDANCVREIA